jgi:plasmid maintenance system antidote protein VapI
MDTYLGHTADYWLELQLRVDILGRSDEKYIKEIAELKGKISFYESRIKEMNALLTQND